MSVRDSKNVQSIHLTGNYCSYYDRLLMRALLPCKVKWPVYQNFIPRFEKISGRDKLTLVMLNVCFLSSMPPVFMPEIGLSLVNNVDEVRKKIRSHEIKRQIDAKINSDSKQEGTKAHVGHFQPLITAALDTLLVQKKKEAAENPS